MEQFNWKGEENRPLTLARPCPCGCDIRDGFKGIGYLTASNKNGEGFTIWIEDEEVFQRISQVVPLRKLD